jgi:hypothetical protein
MIDPNSVALALSTHEMEKSLSTFRNSLWTPTKHHSLVDVPVRNAELSLRSSPLLPQKFSRDIRKSFTYLQGLLFLSF